MDTATMTLTGYEYPADLIYIGYIQRADTNIVPVPAEDIDPIA